MDRDDPFSDHGGDDRTVIRPQPGGRLRRPIPAPPTVEITPSISTEIPRIKAQQNALIAAAFPLLTLVIQLRNSVTQNDIEGLRRHVIEEIRNFESHALQQGVLQHTVQAARYALCSLIDESVLNTPWGSTSDWGHKSLLVSFHQEAWGGEKFFDYVNQFVRQPASNLDLLELYYHCLSVGFEGKYRVQENGLTKLNEFRENLYLLIQRHRGDYEKQLSVHWEGLKDKRNPLIRYVPFWVVAAIAGFLLGGIYIAFSYFINAESNPVLNDLAQMGLEKPTFVVEKPPKPESISRFKELKAIFNSEIQRGSLELVKNSEGIVLRIRGLFPSANAQVRSGFHPLIRRISENLADPRDKIVVAGYTDSIPIFTTRFHSNWELSQARAKSVVNLLKQSGDFENRVGFEGRADNQPLVSNDTAANRAINRRVEIIIKEAL